jgi:hypothetical protein
MGEVTDYLLQEVEGRKSIILLEGSQASTPRHSDKTRVKVKMLK